MKSRALVVLVVLSVFVLLSTPAFAADWKVPVDFATIQEAIDSPDVVAGDRILVGPGSFAGALVTKGVHIQGVGGATISSGPLHPSGMVQGFRLFAGSDGTTISHLRFTVDLAIINASFQKVDSVTVTQNTIINPVQGVSAWLGTGWEITQNDIVDLRTRCGGGIAILLGDYNNGVVTDNLVSHNRISGTVHVSAGDCGGYNATGIVIYADFRPGRFGSQHIAYNRIVKNDVALTSDTPSVVDVVAIELTEADDPNPLVNVIHDNAVGFNDLRGMAEQIVVTPSTLDNPVNDISRNLGENRGQGLHPSAFHGD